MFSLEITFADDSADSETVFVQRPHAVIGASDHSHVVISELITFPYELHLFRGIGRSFRTLPVVVHSNLKVETPEALDGVYEEQALLDLGTLQIYITALDSDLVIGAAGAGEGLDRSSVQTLRRACEKPAPHLPAITTRGEHPITLSFAADTPLLVGRDKESHLRLDARDVSGRHAQISPSADGSPGQFVVRDLGSTNGTYVSGQQVVGSAPLPAKEPVVFGRSVVAYLLDREADMEVPRETSEVDLKAIPEERYPMLVSLSEVVRPQRLVVPEGKTVRIGREPSSDMWLGAPHVSRKHCTVELLGEVPGEEQLTLTDLSLNGLAYDGGVLSQGESVEMGRTPCVLNFGGGITVAVCFTEDHERQFLQSEGEADAFRDLENGERVSPQSQDLHSYESQSQELQPYETQALDEFRSHAEKPSSGRGRRGALQLRRRFFALRLHQRLAVLFTLFLVLLAGVLALKIFIPIITQNI